MNSQELQRAYGDSHTLDRPNGEEAASLFRPARRAERFNPLESRKVCDEAHEQGWGN